MLPFSQLREDVFQTIGINAGVLVSDFDLETRTYDRDDIIGATTGSVSFEAKPAYTDYGADINNCPKNTRELMRLNDWSVKLSGTLVTGDSAAARRLIGLADIDAQDAHHIVPRAGIDVLADFGELWYLFDYGDVNAGNAPGLYAIHMKNALSSGGFRVQTADKEKAQWPFEFTCHYALDDLDEVPFEVYVLQGETETAATT